MNPSHRHATPRQASTPPPHAGFTLVELMAAISIISILMIAGTIASMKMFSNTADHKTRITLAAAKSIADEYTILTGNTVNHLTIAATATFPNPNDWSTTKTYNQRIRTLINPDIPGSTALYYTISGNPKSSTKLTDDSETGERFLWVVMQVPAINRMLVALGPDTFVDREENGHMELRDGWGNKMHYAAYVSHSDSDTADDILPEHGNPTNPKPFFASAGPDGQWGDASPTPDQQSQDNIYSYDLN